MLNITAEFSAEELETALITPNSTLDDVHIPLLKAIPPVIRMAVGPGTWVTGLCRKLRDWWHWVADGDIPIVASHGEEVEMYKTLEPAIRVVILKALCDIRVEQEDIRSYIDKSLKQGIQLSTFQRERIGGDSHGISYWYEDDNIIGHRLYREIRQVEEIKTKARRRASPHMTFQWETVATNLDEFQDVSDKLFSSKNRTEATVGKHLKIDILPDIEMLQKKKEKALKKQHRQALLLDNVIPSDGLTSGRSLRDRKPVTYTFDDYDRSISEALKATNARQSSPANADKQNSDTEPEPSANGRLNGTPNNSKHVSYETKSPVSTEYNENEGNEYENEGNEHENGGNGYANEGNEYENEDNEYENERTEEEISGGDDDLQSQLDRSDRRRKRPQRYSEKDYIEAVSENSEDDIVGEAVYDDKYVKNRKPKKESSSSEEGDGDEEYRWEDENTDEEEEEEEEDDDGLSNSDDDSYESNRRSKRTRTRSRRVAKKRSVDAIKPGLRRSKRSTRPRINYKQIELSETEEESEQSYKSDSTSNDDNKILSPSEDSEDNEQVMEDVKMVEKSCDVENVRKEEDIKAVDVSNDESPIRTEGTRKRRFLDLNQLAPDPSTKDEDNDDP